MENQHQKFNQNDLLNAVNRMLLVKFFPSDGNARGALMEFLVLICPHKEALEWLVSEVVNKVGQWPGAADLRGLLSTRYTPADGLRMDCGIIGYRPEDYEARELDRHYVRMHGGIPADELKRIEGEAIAQISQRLIEGHRI